MSFNAADELLCQSTVELCDDMLSSELLKPRENWDYEKLTYYISLKLFIISEPHPTAEEIISFTKNSGTDLESINLRTEHIIDNLKNMNQREYKKLMRHTRIQMIFKKDRT